MPDLRPKIGVVALAALGWLAAGTAALGAEQAETPRREVRVEEGRLSVALERAPAGEVFEAIARQGKLVIRFDRSLLAVPLTTEFEREPLERGLRRLIALLQTENFRMEFGGEPGTEPRIERVEILAASTPGGAVEFSGRAGSAAAGPGAQKVPKGVQQKIERDTARGFLSPGEEHRYERTGHLPRRLTHAPEGLLLKQERGEPVPKGAAWKLERALRFGGPQRARAPESESGGEAAGDEKLRGE